MRRPPVPYALCILVLLGGGDAVAQGRVLSWNPFYYFDLAEHESAGVELGGLDADGDLDVVLAKGRHWAERDFAGSGDSFVRAQLGEEAADTYGIGVGDLDGDHYPDAVFANVASMNQVFLNRLRKR